MTSAASLKDRLALCSPSAAITCDYHQYHFDYYHDCYYHFHYNHCVFLLRISLELELYTMTVVITLVMLTSFPTDLHFSKQYFCPEKH